MCPVLTTHFETISTYAPFASEGPSPNPHTGFINPHSHFHLSKQLNALPNTPHLKNDSELLPWICERVALPRSSLLTIEETRSILVSVHSLLIATHWVTQEPTNRLGATANGASNSADGVADPDGGVDDHAERAEDDQRDERVRDKD